MGAAASFALLDRLTMAGLTFIDTTDVYSAGLALCFF